MVSSWDFVTGEREIEKDRRRKTDPKEYWIKKDRRED